MDFARVARCYLEESARQLLDAARIEVAPRMAIGKEMPHSKQVGKTVEAPMLWPPGRCGSGCQDIPQSCRVAFVGGCGPFSHAAKKGLREIEVIAQKFIRVLDSNPIGRKDGCREVLEVLGDDHSAPANDCRGHYMAIVRIGQGDYGIKAS